MGSSSHTSPSFVTVTKLGDVGPTVGEAPAVCRWCRRPLAQLGRGRPREFCKRSCRQREFEQRRLAASHGIDEREIVLARTELDRLRDDLYVLACAVEDVGRDVTSTSTAAELRQALAWLLAAARPLRDPLPSKRP